MKPKLLNYMEKKYKALCTRATSYRDNDLMLNLFTLENGLVAACLRGAKKAGAKLKFAGELFCFGEFVLAEKSGRNTITEVTQLDNFYDIRLNDKTYFAGCAVLEFINAFVMEDLVAYELFLLVIRTLNELKKPDNILNKLTNFYIQAISYSGYEIDFSNCAKCSNEIEERAFVDLDKGSFVCADCATAEYTEIRISTYKLLKKLSIKVENESEADINAFRFIDYYLKSNIGIEIKSNKMLLSSIQQ